MWVSNPERLAREAIPQYYPHSSYASWTRALHAHSFRKLTPSTWGHPDFHRDRPEAAATIGRRRPVPKHQKASSSRVEPAELSLAELSLAPLVPQLDDDNSSTTTTEFFAGAEGGAEDAAEGVEGSAEGAGAEGGEGCGEEVGQEGCVGGGEILGSCDDLEKDKEKPTSTSLQKPSPVQAARLEALREQIVREREAMRQLKALVEKLEAQVTRARREELQQRSQVVQLASWVATAFAASAGIPMPSPLESAAALAEPRKPGAGELCSESSRLLICSAAS